ncbi:hypothetical protein Leryth_023289 [Lithospermum erythrorhizon]|nr:hypothetical protein Leryth_023289 [Lithospermum erythrorhizon]
MEMPRSSKEDKFGTEEKEAYQREHEEKLGGDRGSNVYEISSKEALDHNKSRTSFTRDLCEEGTQKKSLEACEKKDEGTGFDGTLTQKTKVDELKKNVTKEEFDSSKSSPLVINEKPTHEVQCIDEVSHVVEGRHNMNFKNLGLSRKVNSREICVNTSEQFRPVSSTASVNVSEKPFNNVAMIPPRVVSSDQEVKVTFPEVPRVECVTGLQVTVGDGILMEKLRKPQLANEWVDNAKNISDALQTVLVDIGDMHDDYEAEASQGTPTKVNNMSRIRLPEEPKIEKRLRNDGELKHESYMTTKEERERQMQREKDPMAKTQKVGRLKGRELHDEHLKRAEEEREREREREKDRTAVENTIREARERAYVDARERAALERATSEARQRAMAEARERLEKASAEAREARLKAERAAVERATAEARQRAFEKAMSTKCNSETNDRVDRASDKFPSKDMKQNGRSYDSCNIQIQNGPCYTNSSAQVGVEGESPQRCKARLERYQRTTERAAKALAEKNMRDLVAQREQEERSRLAEILDADVKRWSSGKEGNLRALLSTLQYILGPDSGWQPIPLTQVITSAAVKRAYRKATLCVHPDKLQQRGANTQQKYICEKVFDLLKEAWNKFNSEER